MYDNPLFYHNRWRPPTSKVYPMDDWDTLPPRDLVGFGRGYEEPPPDYNDKERRRGRDTGLVLNNGIAITRPQQLPPVKNVRI